jgi:hypothetical protein
LDGSAVCGTAVIQRLAIRSLSHRLEEFWLGLLRGKLFG